MKDTNKIQAVLYMPDGNRRYARAKKMSIIEAYHLGGKTLRLLADFFVAGKRANMVIYHALSEHTHSRTDDSAEPICRAAEETFNGLLREDFFRKRRIRFRAIDHSGKLPAELKKISKALEASTRKFDRGQVIVLLGYSLEKDIEQALSRKPRDYNQFRKGLLFPEIGLVLRPTEMRPSGGPVYAMAQAQMITIDKFNPEISRKDLARAWQDFLDLKAYRVKDNPSLRHKRQRWR